MSSEFSHNQALPINASCDGRGVSPGLEWSNVPHNAKSFALVVDDPDAQQVVGKTFIHWIVYDIPIAVKHVEQNQDVSALGAAEWINSGNKKGYYPACPPRGTHRYFFKIYALDLEKLHVDRHATPEEVIQLIEKHAVAQGELIGLYERQ